MSPAPIEATLRVHAYYTRERGYFVVTCPALRLAAQGKTLAQAKREFLALFAANLEYWQQGGHFNEVMRAALADPDTRLIPAGAKPQPMTLPVPPELIAAAYGSKQETQRRKAA